MLTLYDYFRSSASYRVRIALNLKNLAYHTIPVNLVYNGGEQNLPIYQTINPQSLVPVLQDGDHLITQSLAIMEYLNDIVPTSPLLPADPYTRALVRSFALVIVADTHPLNNIRVLNYLTDTLHISDDERKIWYIHWMENSLAVLEKKLSTSTHQTNYCFGDTPTLADICLVPHLYNARRFHCNTSFYPRLERIDAYCQSHPAFKEAYPIEAIEKAD